MPQKPELSDLRSSMRSASARSTSPCLYETKIGCANMRSLGNITPPSGWRGLDGPSPRRGGKQQTAVRLICSACYSVPGPVQSRAPPPSPRRGQPPGVSAEPYRVRPQSPQPRAHSWPPAARHHRYCGSARCSTRFQFSTKKRLCQSIPLRFGLLAKLRNDTLPFNVSFPPPDTTTRLRLDATLARASTP